MKLQKLSHERPDPRYTFDGLKKWGRLEQWKSMADAIEDIRTWSQNPTGWRVLGGTTGCGKSHLMRAAYNAVPGGVYIYSELLVRGLKQAVRTNSTESLVEAYQDAPVLFLDDLGTEQLMTYNGRSEFVLSSLQGIVEYRYIKRMPTMFTTNLTGAELRERYMRIASRMREPGLSVVHVINVGDYRSR